MVLVAYDLLEHAGQDVREQPQQARRAHLEALLQPPSTTIGEAPAAARCA